jgi:hypothetical protein
MAPRRKINPAVNPSMVAVNLRPQSGFGPTMEYTKARVHGQAGILRAVGVPASVT